MNQNSIKRQSHYFFGHQELRQMVYNEALMFSNIMESESATEFLSDLYNDLKAGYNDQVNIEVTASDFDVTLTDLPENKLIIILLPETIIAPEARRIGIVLPKELKSDPNPEKIRYYTLERADNRSKHPAFVWGEWKGSESHMNYGQAPDSSLETFIEWIREKIGSIQH